MIYRTSRGHYIVVQQQKLLIMLDVGRSDAQMENQFQHDYSLKERELNTSLRQEVRVDGN